MAESLGLEPLNLDLGPDGVLIVGQLNPYGDDPRMALVPYPDGCSGHRLLRILGLPEERYRAMGRVNLCARAWSRAAATACASRLYGWLPDPTEHGEPRTLVVLLGAQVADAFRRVTFVPRAGLAERGPIGLWGEGGDPAGRARWVCLPHPSGANRAWSSGPDGTWAWGGPVDRARQILRRVAPRVPWGEAHPLTMSVRLAAE